MDNEKPSCSGNVRPIKRKNSPTNNKEVETGLEQTNEEKLANVKNENVAHKKSRLDFNFWTQKENTVTIFNSNDNQSIQYLNIKELKLGRIMKKPLKVRIIYKSWPRETNGSSIFSFHGMDHTGEIAFVNFGKECQSLFKKLEVNDIYSIENFLSEKENPLYPSGCNTEYQVKLNPNTNIEHINDDKDIPEISFSFVKFDNIQAVVINQKIDIIGVLVEDYGLDRTARGSFKRDLALTDQSKSMVLATIWLAEAQNFNCEKYSVIAIRKASVIEFQEKKKLNCLSGTLVWCNPNIPAATEIKNWFHETINE